VKGLHGDNKTVLMVEGHGGRRELTLNDVMLLRGKAAGMRVRCGMKLDEAMDAYECHWHNEQGKCVGTAGTTIVTHKGSRGTLGYASLQALVQAQGIQV
jgi:hypothetical protein